MGALGPIFDWGRHISELRIGHCAQTVGPRSKIFSSQEPPYWVVLTPLSNQNSTNEIYIPPFKFSHSYTLKCNVTKLFGWVYLESNRKVLFLDTICFFTFISTCRYKNLATTEQRQEQDEGKLTIMDPSYGMVPVSKQLVEESVTMELDTTKPLEIKCPVKIIHGVQDDTVPYENSLKVMKMISNDNVELIYQKSGDHRLQNDSGLELILRSLDDTLSKI